MNLDKKMTWWWEHQVQQRLIKYTHALMMGRHYKVILTDTGTGYTDFNSRVVQANPTLFASQPVEVQFMVTKAILSHEGGHVLFTDEWPEAAPNNLLNLVNMLEDERVERCMTTLYPGLTEEFDKLGDLEISLSKRMLSEPAAAKVVSACLRWRWLWDKKTGEKKLFELNSFDTKAQDLWNQVKPLVEAAWTAWGTARVIELANQIMDILKLPKDKETIPRCFSRGKISPEGDLGDFTKPPGEEKAMPFPEGPAELEPMPPKVHTATLREYPTGEISRPAPYGLIEEKAIPLAKQLSESLVRPEPESRVGPHDWKGRFSARQDLRTPETPNVHHTLVGESGKNTTLMILVDRSGSMCGFDDAVRLALMTCYLAAIKIKVAVGVIFFGAENDRENELVFMLGPISEIENEAVLAGIAGFHGTTGAEFLDWGLQLARKELLTRPEELKRLIVIHDGQPVYKGDKGNDFAMSLATLKSLPAQGITPIGVYLGSSESDINQLHKLFEHLVVTNGNELPHKLGNMLSSLV
jgi:hypothetical protein